jgi:hypothetical protein
MGWLKNETIRRVVGKTAELKGGMGLFKGGSIAGQHRAESPTDAKNGLAERLLIWGQGECSRTRAMHSAVGRVGRPACREHYNPLARYGPHGNR